MNNNKDFSISEAINFGWETFKSNWKFWIVVTLLVGIGGAGSFGSIGSGANNFSPEKLNQEFNQEFTQTTMLRNFDTAVLGETTEDVTNNINPAAVIGVGLVALIGAAVAFVVMMALALTKIIFKMGHFNLLLDAVRGKELYYKTLLNQVSYKKAFRFLAASALAGILITLGYIFFIIPGILLTLKYMFVPLVVVDEDPGVRKVLKRSSDLTKGVRFKLFLFGLTMIGLSIVGLLALGIGIYIVGIVGSLAFAYIYVKVLEQTAPQKAVPKKAKA